MLFECSSQQNGVQLPKKGCSGDEAMDGIVQFQRVVLWSGNIVHNNNNK
jgi:hypothetical protein